MGDRQLPGGYTEIDRWTLNQASVKEFLLSVLVGLVAFFAALAAAAFVVGTATDSGEVTIDGGTFFSGLLLGGVLGAILHEAVHGVFFPGLRRPAALRVQAVDQVRAGLLRRRPRELPRQASVPRRRVGAGSAADRCAGGSTSIRGRGRPARLALAVHYLSAIHNLRWQGKGDDLCGSGHVSLPLLVILSHTLIMNEPAGRCQGSSGAGCTTLPRRRPRRAVFPKSECYNIVGTARGSAIAPCKGTPGGLPDEANPRKR